MKLHDISISNSCFILLILPLYISISIDEEALCSLGKFSAQTIDHELGTQL